MRWLIASCLAFACSETPTYVLLKVPDPADAGVVTSPDASVPPRDGGVPPDSGVDAGQLPPHDRQLTSYRILGETPIENLVMNPQLDLHTTLTIFGFSGFFRRHHFTRTPSGLPALEASPGDGAVIPAQARPSPLDASIWLGRRGESPTVASIMLTGNARDGSLRSGSLMREAGSRVELDGIVWERFVGTVSENFFGQIQLVIDNGAGQSSLFATGPVVVPAQSGVTGPEFPSIRLQPIDEGLREKLDIAFARAKEQAKRSISLRKR